MTTDSVRRDDIMHWLDVSKGIGIILVILGHCIFPWNQGIDYFHMPLFFLIAGITYKDKGIKDFLISKINRILIPYIFFSIISSLLSFIPHYYGGLFNGPLWFLRNIFVALIIVKVFGDKRPKTKVIMVISMILVTYILAPAPAIRKVLPFGIVLSMLSSIFIIIGATSKGQILTLAHSKIKSVLVLLICTTVFMILSIYANRNSLHGDYISFTLFGSNYILSFLLAISGSLTTFIVSILITRNRILEWFGRNSLVIMCVHFPFAMFLNWFISTIPLEIYQSYKLIIVPTEWLIVGGCSAILCIVCKRYIPKLTGFKTLIN